MSDDATLPPSARRRRRAWKAGLRPRSPWLGRGVFVLGIMVVLESCSSSALLEPEFWRERLQGDLDTESLANLLGAMTSTISSTLLSLIAVSLGAVVLTTLLVSGLGPIDGSERARLGSVGRTRPGVGALVMGCILTAGLLWAFTAALPASARAVDASPAGLQLFWWSWLTRSLMGTGIILLAFGVIDAIVSRRRYERALYQTVEEALQEQAKAARS